MIKTAVMGAAGYTGIELVRWLLNHPNFELTLASSDSDAGARLDELYPALLGASDIKFVPHQAVVDAANKQGDVDTLAAGLDLVFLAVPHTAAMQLAPAFLKQGVSVIDLSADFRLNDPLVFEQWYGVAHGEPALLNQAVYGLVEVNRAELESSAAARKAGVPALIANPGCYPTATLLAAYPALKIGIQADGVIVVNAISGVSGAGRKALATTHFCSVSDNLAAYGATTHRHTPEIAQGFAAITHKATHVVFTPHLAPLKRGMVSTVVLPLVQGVSEQECQQVYRELYKSEPFVHLLNYQTMPQSSSVAGTNQAHVGIAYDKQAHCLVASCAIDNLGKGAAAQAIQNANLLFELPETAGLSELPCVV